MSVTDINTATVTVSFDQKLPDAVQYSSRSSFVSLSVPVDIEGLTLEQATDKLQQVRAALDTEVKLAVFASLGVQPKEIAEGVLAADLGGVAAAAPKAAAAPRQQSNRRPPATNFNDPEVDVEWRGSTVTVRDLRDAKATGRIKATMPDLKIGDQPYWLSQRDGSVNAEAAELAALVDAAA